MKKQMMKIVLCLSASLLFGLNSRAEENKLIRGVEFKASDGSVLIEDGDSFWIGIHRVRLLGIDTIESNQTCESKGMTIDCHAETMAYVTPLFKDPTLVCRPILGKNEKPKIDQGGRYVVICETKSGELNRKLISDGWAVPDRDNAVPSFAALQKAAKAKGAGLHRYTFKHPHDHRNPPKSAAACPTPT